MSIPAQCDLGKRCPWLVLMLLLTGCQKIEVRSLAREGNQLYRAGKYHQALAKFVRAADLDPRYPRVQLHLGYTGMALLSANPNSMRAKAHATLAAKAFKRFMALQPKDPRGPKYYLQLLLDADRYDDAIAFLEARLKAHPGDLKTIASLGTVNSRAGRFDEALRWYQLRAKRESHHAKPLYLVGTLCWQYLNRHRAEVLGDRRTAIADRGIAALKRALALRPGYVEALTYVNLLYRQRALAYPQDAKRAEADLQQARRFYKKALLLSKARHK